LSSAGIEANEQRALQRAGQSLRCLPFRRAFYDQLEARALSSSEFGGLTEWSRYSRRPLGSSRAEDHFIWLIQLGVLRREVDGQGLTERVRLTPLGRQVLASLGQEIRPAGPLLQLRHWLQRHRPRL
jgi:hypothetical protein